MNLLATSHAVVRTWTHVYTWRLPAIARDRRRAEIESDLWESAQAHDARALVPAFQACTRLLRGIPDDLRWRASHVTIGVAPLRAAIGVCAAAITLLAIWVYTVAMPTELPSPAPLVRVVNVSPPPPPPPPPPPRFTRR